MSLMSYLADMKVRAELGFVEKVQDLAACGLRVVEKQPGARASGEPTSPVVRQSCAGWVHVYLVEPRVRGDRCQDTAEDKRRAMHQNERRAHCQVAALSQPRVGEEERRRRRAATRSRRSGLGRARLLRRAPPVSPHVPSHRSHPCAVVSRNAQVRRVGEIPAVHDLCCVPSDCRDWPRGLPGLVDRAREDGSARLRRYMPGSASSGRRQPGRDEPSVQLPDGPAWGSSCPTAPRVEVACNFHSRLVCLVTCGPMEAGGAQQILASMPLLAHMEQGDRTRIASMLDAVSFPESGSIIIREGDLGETLFFVVGGEAFAEIKGEVVMRYTPGDYFGELSLLTGAPRKATVKAGPKGARCLVLTRELFNTLDFNEAMWQERQRMYEVANAERIQQFFATSSDDSGDEQRDDDYDTPAEGIPPASEQMLVAEVTQLTAANAELRQQLSKAKLEIEQTEARNQKLLAFQQELITSIGSVRDAQAALENSSRAYDTSVQVRVEASAEEVAVLTSANATLSAALKGLVDRTQSALLIARGHQKQQPATREDADAVVNATLRNEVAKREQQVRDLEAALRDAHRQHAKREWLVRGAVDARSTAHHRLYTSSQDLASAGYMPDHMTPQHRYEDAMDDSRVFDMRSDRQSVEKMRVNAAGNVAPLALDDTMSSTEELMELVDLVRKEF